MAKRIDVSDLNIFYGDFLAVEDVVDDHRAPLGHRVHRPVRLRQVDLPAHAQPHARGHPRRAGRGQVLIDGQDLYGAGVDPVEVRRQIGMVFQRPNPFPTMSIYENVAAGLQLNDDEEEGRCSTRSSRSRCSGANLWNEVKDRLDSPAPASPAASSSGCASRAPSRSSRRCC